MPKKVVSEQLDDLRFLGGIYQEIENQFKTLNYEEPLRAFSQTLAEAHRGYFDRGAGPSGSAWQPLSARTIRRKGHNVILVDKRKLSRSLAEAMGGGEAIREFTHRGMIWGTGVEYSIWHQRGTPRLPQREHVGIDERTLEKLLENVAAHVVEGLKP